MEDEEKRRGRFADVTSSLPVRSNSAKESGPAFSERGNVEGVDVADYDCWWRFNSRGIINKN